MIKQSLQLNLNHHCLIKTNYFIKNSKKLKNIFKNGAGDSEIVYRKRGQSIKERLAKKNINTKDSSKIVS